MNKFKSLFNFRFTSILIIVLFFIPAWGDSQPLRINPHDWMDKNETDPYIEGIYAQDIGTKEIELKSLYYSIEWEDDANKKELYFDFYFEIGKPYFLKIDELELDDYYLLESKTDTTQTSYNTFGPWDLSYFFDNSFKTPDEGLAFLLTLEEEGKENYHTPLSIYQTEKSSTEEVIAVFQYNRSISEGYINVYKDTLQGAITDQVVLYHKEIGSHSGVGSFDISISTEKFTNYTGWVTVDLIFRPKNRTDWKSKRFYFYIKS